MVREIVDVVFKATENGQKIGEKTFKKYQPVFMIDTATTSSLEQSTTTVYAQGGKGYNRLIAWEGEKTMTFTVTDALMSPMGLAVLTGAGLITPNKSNQTHVHATVNAYVDANGEAKLTLDDLRKEMGLADAVSFDICAKQDVGIYATELDGSGAGINYFDTVTIKNATGEYVKLAEDAPVTFIVGNNDGTKAKNITVQLDFYVVMNNAVTEVHIEPSSFGGYFYIEAQTLFRREDSGKDMAAEIIIPKAKVQSAFTFTMAASGDPSTFDFVMDAMPGYTKFDSTTKKMCVIQIIGVDKPGETDTSAHTHDEADPYDTPAFEMETRANAISGSAVSDRGEGYVQNQNNVKVSKTTVDGKDNITLTVVGPLDNTIEPVAGWGAADWVVFDYDTGLDTIEGLTYVNRGTETELTAEDVADATALGLGAGHLAVWGKPSVAAVTPATFQLKKGEETVADVSITATGV